MPSKKPSVKKAKSELKKAPKAVAKPKKTEKMEAKVASSKAKSVSLNASVLDTKGKTVGHLTLPSEIFGVKVNEMLVAQAVRVYLANQRLGTAKTKDRGEVNRTTQKVWRQKGTGRARHGSRRAPIFVGGGVAFGPRPKDPSLNLSKKMKNLALFSALSSKLLSSEIKIIKGLEKIDPKTKIMSTILKNLGLEETQKILLVMPKISTESQNVYRAARNIEGVQILSANTLNAYRVLDNKMILFMNDSINTIKDTFIKDKKSVNKV